VQKEKAKKRLLHFANKHLGKPYKFGAESYDAPQEFDCSSFIQYLYARVNIDLPRAGLQQASCGKKITPTSELEVGDLLFLKGTQGHYNKDFPEGIGHVVLYIGKGKVVHASGDAGEVIEEPVNKFLNRSDLVVIKRILG